MCGGGAVKHCPECDYPNPAGRTTCFKCQTALDDESVTTASQDVHDLTGDPTISGDAEPNVCASCGAPPEDTGYEFKLCTVCRDNLARRALPKWVVVSAFAVMLVLAYAFIMFPCALRAGIAFERGLKAEAVLDYGAAAAQYEIVVNRFPDSTLALSRLCVCQCKTGNGPGAAATLMKLEGREAPNELVDEVESAAEEFGSEQAE